MPTCFPLTILTPDKRFWDAPAQHIVFSTPEGSIGVMAGHEDSVVALAEGIVKIQNSDGEWRIAAISQGFAEITDTLVELFVDSVEWAEDIDIARASDALRRAEGRLTQKNLSRIEHLRTNTAIARASARLKAANSANRIS